MNKEEQKRYYEMGKNFGMGLWSSLWSPVIWFLIIYIIISTLLSGTDDSDKGYFERSDLKLHTDYKTGLQYFSTSGGGLCPRLDKDGKLIFIKE